MVYVRMEDRVMVCVWCIDRKLGWGKIYSKFFCKFSCSVCVCIFIIWYIKIVICMLYVGLNNRGGFYRYDR